MSGPEEMFKDHELDEFDRKVLETSLRFTADPVTGQREIPEQDLMAVMAFEKEMEINKGIVDNILNGDMQARFKGKEETDSIWDTENYEFTLTEKGKTKAEELMKKMGIPNDFPRTFN